MKNILLTLSAAVVLLAACKSSKKDDALQIDKSIVFTDTSALRQGNYSTDVAQNGNNLPAFAPEEKQPEAKPQVRTVTKIIRVVEKQQAPVVKTETPPAVTPPVQAPAEVPGAIIPSAGTVPSGTDVATAPVPVPEKKKNEGWSGAAKGAAIGGIGGAVAGAVIGKGGKGAIIGGVVGAAGGYILGRKADKKSGRVELVQK